jgi:hypothetical protein
VVGTDAFVRIIGGPFLLELLSVSVRSLKAPTFTDLKLSFVGEYLSGSGTSLGVAVAVGVAVLVAIAVRVAVAVGVGVLVAVRVAVDVAAGVLVAVRVAVDVAVGVLVAVRVAVAVALGVLDAVAVGPPPCVISPSIVGTPEFTTTCPRSSKFALAKML